MKAMEIPDSVFPPVTTRKRRAEMREFLDLVTRSRNLDGEGMEGLVAAARALGARHVLDRHGRPIPGSIAIPWVPEAGDAKLEGPVEQLATGSAVGDRNL